MAVSPNFVPTSGLDKYPSMPANVVQPAGNVFKIHNLSDVDTTLLERASCAAHGLDKFPQVGFFGLDVRSGTDWTGSQPDTRAQWWMQGCGNR